MQRAGNNQVHWQRTVPSPTLTQGGNAAVPNLPVASAALSQPLGGVNNVQAQPIAP